MSTEERTALMLAYITCATVEEASTIGERLVSERLAACVNILPGMRSLYWWQGVVTSSSEAVLIAKGPQALAERLTERVRQLHSYQCPCVLILPVAGGNPAYLEWLAGVVRPPG
jgi:periplasmic divalent cation tolerance protein